jgi:prepilin-type N-terminal cleavage/methylation domain-containing protein
MKIPQRAFTLAEMAIVVLIGGIMLTMSLKTWIAKLNNSAYAETASKQAQIKIALIGFLRTNGRLPCPSAMSTAVPPVPTGLEILGLPAGRGCINNPYGEIPWASLGV